MTGRLAAFAPHAKVIHVDIDPAEIGKNPHADLPIVGDVKRVLEQARPRSCRRLAPETARKNATARASLVGADPRLESGASARRPSSPTDEIKPQHLMAEIDRLSGGEAIVASDVGQHQMWAAQFIRFNQPRLWINSGGLGSMGFGLPSAIGAQFARPDKLVFAIVRRRRLPDVDPGTRHHRQSRPADQDHRHEQRLPRHGPPMAGAVLQQPPQRRSSWTRFPDAEKLAGAYGFKGRTVEQAVANCAGARRRGATSPVRTC